MSRSMAFLRAINVGKRRVKMDDLCKIFEKMGFKNVESFIASGNIVFDSKNESRGSIEDKIEAGLKKALGYDVTTFVRNDDELKNILNHKAFAASELAAENNVVYVGFLKEPATNEAKEKIGELENEAHEFHYNDKEIYWLRRRDLDKFDYSGKEIEKGLRAETTMRNMNTIERMVKKFC